MSTRAPGNTLSAAKKRNTPALRDLLHRAVRRFFVSRGFAEVSTPVRLTTPALEPHIDALHDGDAWLRTSPEFQLKRRVMCGAGKIFEIGPCYRAGEQGRLHNTKFTMLEWYETGADYRRLITFTNDLIREVVHEINGEPRFDYQGATIDCSGTADLMTVDNAFRHFAGTPSADAVQAGRFEELLAADIEPRLGRTRPMFLTDYPIEQAGFVKAHNDTPDVCERWELYIAGVELANAGSELTDAADYRQRFVAAAAARRALGRTEYPIDDEFLEVIAAGLPPHAGCALGLDRLLMLLADKVDIQAD